VADIIVSSILEGNMKTSLVTFLALVTGLLAVCGPMFAHHGGAIYDTTTPITLKGIVTEFAWANPHVQIYFDVKDDKGNVVHWACETVSPGKLARGSGWTRDSLKAGDQITITLNPAKAGTPVGGLRKIVFADGKVLTPAEPPPGEQ
jgi:uncharacterized protein DUF6152